MNRSELRKQAQRARSGLSHLNDEANRMQNRIDELEAEIERLRRAAKLADEMYEQAATQANDYSAENAALRVEVERLREEQAFWRKHLSVASPKMDSQHIWRLFNGWPPLVGPDADAVVRNALEAIRSQPLPAPPAKEE